MLSTGTVLLMSLGGMPSMTLRAGVLPAAGPGAVTPVAAVAVTLWAIVPAAAMPSAAA
ncbi:hypothetical protein PV416_22270 [Streptomyces ipomoeae]|uniref:hypothetical protein n=1 Tax=Streptomyces ipomoeae TaxID=103232 RepID=UPI0029B2DDA5|nr:hypothetical protein [Streptomyces ipomoeae]MDX2823754.1 hypothetical protein [Streptomyces ipomoeae]